MIQRDLRVFLSFLDWGFCIGVCVCMCVCMWSLSVCVCNSIIWKGTKKREKELCFRSTIYVYVCSSNRVNTFWFFFQSSFFRYSSGFLLLASLSGFCFSPNIWLYLLLFFFSVSFESERVARRIFCLLFLLVGFTISFFFFLV